jgi:CDP-diacylglycerol pyrophosphatase
VVKRKRLRRGPVLALDEVSFANLQYKAFSDFFNGIDAMKMRRERRKVPRRSILRALRLAVGATALGSGSICGAPADYFDDIAASLAANRNELWAVVHDICLPAYQGIGVTFPCVEVNIANGLDRGFVVLQKPSSATHVIVVPTIPISGIESPALLSEGAPNYWEAAWDARRFVEEGARRRLPRDKIGMAINSAASRSQDQLHIHVACVAPAVANFLRRHQAEIHGAWSFLSSLLLGHRFAAMKVETDGLANVDPFKLLAHGLPSGKFSMARQTLAVIGATFRDGKTGFYLLANDSGASPRSTVSAEALLDDKCGN